MRFNKVAKIVPKGTSVPFEMCIHPSYLCGWFCLLGQNFVLIQHSH